MDYRNISVGDKVVFTPNKDADLTWEQCVVDQQKESGGYLTVRLIAPTFFKAEDANDVLDIWVEGFEFVFSANLLEPFVEETAPPCQVGGDLDEV
jgi:hypothetical protein